MNSDTNNKPLKRSREPQLIGEKKERVREKSFFDTSDVCRRVLESLGMDAIEDRTIRRIVELMMVGLHSLVVILVVY